MREQGGQAPSTPPDALHSLQPWWKGAARLYPSLNSFWHWIVSIKRKENAKASRGCEIPLSLGDRFGAEVWGFVPLFASQMLLGIWQKENTTVALKGLPRGNFSAPYTEKNWAKV